MTYEYASENYHDEVDIEFARGEVATLRNEIVALGHVNIDAIEEYKEVSSRYENMNSQRLDLIQAQDKILSGSVYLICALPPPNNSLKTLLNSLLIFSNVVENFSIII